MSEAMRISWTSAKNNVAKRASRFKWRNAFHQKYNDQVSRQVSCRDVIFLSKYSLLFIFCARIVLLLHLLEIVKNKKAGDGQPRVAHV